MFLYYFSTAITLSLSLSFYVPLPLPPTFSPSLPPSLSLFLSHSLSLPLSLFLSTQCFLCDGPVSLPPSSIFLGAPPDYVVFQEVVEVNNKISMRGAVPWALIGVAPSSTASTSLPPPPLSLFLLRPPSSHSFQGWLWWRSSGFLCSYHNFAHSHLHWRTLFQPLTLPLVPLSVT